MPVITGVDPARDIGDSELLLRKIDHRALPAHGALYGNVVEIAFAITGADSRRAGSDCDGTPSNEG
jgi:hypothetical protein